MSYYNSIYASSYRFYAKFKGETPWSTSIILVTVCQIELFFLLLTIIKKSTEFNPFLILPNKFYFLPIFSLWFFLMFKYYNKERALRIVDEFEQNNMVHKKLWGILTLISFLLPLVLIFILLKR